MLFQRLMNPPQNNQPLKEVPTLRAVAPRFLDRHARANRQKPSGIAAKTVNNILTVLNVLVKNAVDWDVIDRIPCAVTLLPVLKTSMFVVL